MFHVEPTAPAPSRAPAPRHRTRHPAPGTSTQPRTRHAALGTRHRLSPFALYAAPSTGAGSESRFRSLRRLVCRAGRSGSSRPARAGRQQEAAAAAEPGEEEQLPPRSQKLLQRSKRLQVGPHRPHGHGVGETEELRPLDDVFGAAGFDTRILKVELADDLPEEGGLPRLGFDHPQVERRRDQLQGNGRRSPPDPTSTTSAAGSVMSRAASNGSTRSRSTASSPSGRTSD